MWSIASSVGIVQLKVTKWRFSRCGMSFLPPPGWFIAAMYWTFRFLEWRYGLTHLDVHQSGKVSRLLKTVEAALFNHRSEKLICALQSVALILVFNYESLLGLPMHWFLASWGRRWRWTWSFQEVDHTHWQRNKIGGRIYKSSTFPFSCRQEPRYSFGISEVLLRRRNCCWWWHSPLDSSFSSKNTPKLFSPSPETILYISFGRLHPFLPADEEKIATI